MDGVGSRNSWSIYLLMYSSTELNALYPSAMKSWIYISCPLVHSLPYLSHTYTHLHIKPKTNIGIKTTLLQTHIGTRAKITIKGGPPRCRCHRRRWWKKNVVNELIVATGIRGRVIHELLLGEQYELVGDEVVDSFHRSYGREGPAASC